MGSRLDKKSDEIRKRIQNHTFTNEEGDEYGASKFGGFTEYFRRKKIKLQNLDQELRENSTDKPKIFRGVVAHINGYTQPSLNDLHEIIVSHGGGFIQYLDGKTMVTHIIASNLTPKKAVEFRRYRIVKPAWVVDSVKAGRLLPWNDYRVIDEGVGQKVLGFDNGQVVTQTNNRVKGYRDQTDASWYTSQLQKQQSSSGEPTGLKRFSGTQTSTPGDDDIFDDSEFEDLEEKAALAVGRTVGPIPVVSDPDVLDDQTEERHEDISSLQTPPQTSPHISPVQNTSTSRDVQSASSELDDIPNDPQGRSVSKGTKRDRSPDQMSPSKAAKLTAEEHNAILLADPRIRKSTVVHPDFLEQYYRESRLHHLSTWKADLKSQLQALTAETSASQKARQKRPIGARRYIMHVDFDSFFVAVSLKKCPHLKDKPCVVAHGGGSGSEIASCNYPARKFGVSNGMWMKRAQELCSNLEVLPYDFPAYEDASRKFYDAILATGGVVQSVSIDEALVDISAQCIATGGTDGVRSSEGSNFREQSKADEMGEELRKKVLDRTGCNVSVGIGANILLAKVALRKAKPAGQFHLKPEQVLDFIGALEVQSLPGVAGSMGAKLEEIGIRYVKDIRECTREKLTTTLGPKTGEKIWDYARGIDRTEVGDQVVRKSVSAEVNWGVRFENQEQVDEFIENLCGELQKRLIKERVKGRQLTLKVMRRSPDAPLDPPKHLGHGKCDTYNKSVQLGVATNDAKVTAKETLSIMRGFGFTPGELRGIGVQMQKLEPIKGDGLIEGSQRRLKFKLGEPSKPKIPELKPERSEDPIQDEVQTPKHNRVRDAPSVRMPADLLIDSPSKKPLNMMGTQFALPTQVDPSVLAELPEDIRSKLIRQIKAPAVKPSEKLDVDSEANESAKVSVQRRVRRDSPAVELPNESQLDPAILAALPEDVRADVLASYQRSPRKAREQAVLPQSPRKNRIAPPIRGSLGRKRGRGGLFAGVRGLRSGDNSTLTQSNFVALTRQGREGTPTDTDGEPGPADLDNEFLAALPEELRQEVIQQHRQQRLRRTGGIDLSMHQKPRGRKQAKANQQEVVERMFKLPPATPKPTFTKEKLSELPDLRQMIKDWVREFWDDEPFAEDVKALVSYLKAVVTSERDIAKAVKIVKWFSFTVEQEGEGKWQGDEMLERWDSVLAQVRNGVQEAVRGRGLAPLDL